MSCEPAFERFNGFTLSVLRHREQRSQVRIDNGSSHARVLNVEFCSFRFLPFALEAEIHTGNQK